MTISTELNEAFAAGDPLSENHFSICDEPNEISRSMRVLERLAGTLGIPVSTFFETHSQSAPSDEASAQDVADLTRAFLAIGDPVMRRYCLDVVQAAGADEPSAR